MASDSMGIGDFVVAEMIECPTTTVNEGDKLDVLRAHVEEVAKPQDAVPPKPEAK